MPSPLEVSHVFHLSGTGGRHVWGGAERHLRILLPALAARGVDVEAIVLVTNPSAQVDEGLAELERAGVRVTRLERRSRGSLARRLPAVVAQHLRLAALLRRRRGRVVHLHLDMVGAPLAAGLARCPRTVMTLHLDEQSWRARRWRLWLRLVDRVVARYVAISGRVGAYWREVARVAPERIDVVPYGIAEPGPSCARRAQLGVPEEGFVAGFVGRLVEQKDPLVLVEALGGVAGVRLVLIGDGPLRGALERRVAEAGHENVVFAGAREDAAGLLPLLDVLCLPSRFEGLGLVLLEAMARGVPCVGSRAGAIPEVLGQGRCGVLVEAGDAAGLRAAVLALRDDPMRRARLADAGRAQVRARFTVARMAERTCAVYAACTGSLADGAYATRPGGTAYAGRRS
ncbi:MAG: glycosyltransferase family 4 protein [Thermodesulfobacteriota bacterium]